MREIHNHPWCGRLDRPLVDGQAAGMEPISLTVAAIVAAVAAKATDHAADAVVEGGEGALRRVIGRVRERFAGAGDEDGARALELVEQVPDSPRLVRGLAEAVDRHVVEEPGFAQELEQLAARAREGGVDVESIVQVALGDQAVQIAGVQSSTITVTHGAPTPPRPAA